MDPASLLVLACVGGIAFGVWDLLSHRAEDVLLAASVFLGGMLGGAVCLAYLPAALGGVAFAGLAAASTLWSWRSLRVVALRRVETLRRVEGGIEGPTRALALREVADRIEARAGGWLGPVLAAVFGLSLAGSGYGGTGLLPLLAAVAAIFVPFARLARKRVDDGELRGTLGILEDGEGEERTDAARLPHTR